MASTNKTTNYELSQFIGADKPAWLADYNSDMGKIDAGLHTAQTTATGADGKADANTTSIGTLTNLTTDTKTDLVSAINEVDGHADTAQNTASSANTLAGQANTKIGELTTYLSMKNHKTLTVNLTGSNSGNIVSSTVRSAYNNAGSFGKVYGNIDFAKSAVTSTLTFTFTDTGLRPSTDITINSAVIYTPYDSNYHLTSMKAQDLVIHPNGTATVTFTAQSSVLGGQLAITPFCIFAEDFGD